MTRAMQMREVYVAPKPVREKTPREAKAEMIQISADQLRLSDEQVRSLTENILERPTILDQLQVGRDHGFSVGDRVWTSGPDGPRTYRVDSVEDAVITIEPSGQTRRDMQDVRDQVAAQASAILERRMEESFFHGVNFARPRGNPLVGHLEPGENGIQRAERIRAMIESMADTVVA